jgi:hypothetical protein
MLFMPLRSAASHIFCFAKSECCATPRLAGKTAHSVPIVAAGATLPLYSACAYRLHSFPILTEGNICHYNTNFVVKINPAKRQGFYNTEI